MPQKAHRPHNKPSKLRHILYKDRDVALKSYTEDEIVSFFFSLEIWYILEWTIDEKILCRVIKQALSKGYMYIVHMVFFENPEMLEIFHKNDFPEIEDDYERIKMIYPEYQHYTLTFTSSGDRGIRISNDMLQKCRKLRLENHKQFEIQMKEIMGELELSDLCDRFDEQECSDCCYTYGMVWVERIFV